MIHVRNRDTPVQDEIAPLYPAASVDISLIRVRNCDSPASKDRIARPGALRDRKARPKPGSLMMVTPTMRSWNQFSVFIVEWDELRRGA